MLIDGNSLTYRAFHALPPELATSTGQVTNAVLGFTNMLIFLVNDHNPDAIAVAWDRPEPTFRHKALDTYKANRSETPDALLSQFPLVKEVLNSLSVPQVEKVGVEADDILATLATQAADAGEEVLLVTGDRDSYQLVQDPGIKVVYNKRGVTDYALYDEAGIEERTGVKPSDYVKYAALRGDKSDNLPGVPGVGEKTAAKLINTYGGIDGIYEAIDDHSPKLKENLIASEDDVRMNLEVMDLLRDVELDTSLDEIFEPEDIDIDQVQELCSTLEFNAVYPRLMSAFGVTVDVVEAETLEVVSEKSTLKKITAVCKKLEDGEVIGLSYIDRALKVAVADKVYSASVSEDDDFTKLDLELGRLTVSVHGYKRLWHELIELGWDLGNAFDVAIAGYLIDPAATSEYPIAELCQRHTDIVIPGSAVDGGQLSLDMEQDSHNAEDVETAALVVLGESLQSKLEDLELTDLMDTMETPLALSLARMERTGIAVDIAALKSLASEMESRVEDLRSEIHKHAGEEFNVNSTKVLQRILFDQLGLMPQKKTKTGYSTNQATLEKLLGEHPIIESILDYREVEKLRSTYGQPLIDSVSDDGRIHATFRQTVARTGRLSSENPNLHNIPVRSSLGKQFRTVFTGSKNSELVVADYNQIELRCIAHLSDDPGLVEAFTTGTDIHRATAAKIYEIEPDEVTSEQREYAKMVSYGLAYGMEAYGLAQRLDIPTGEAQEILDSYFEGFPAVQAYMDASVAEAKDRGYTVTLFGRRRSIPELHSPNWSVRAAAERQAMNAGIQGLAADIFKMAIIRVDRALVEAGLKARTVLQVHDEVIIDTPTKEVEETKKLVETEMKSAFELKVPLEVNLATGKTWADAKG